MFCLFWFCAHYFGIWTVVGSLCLIGLSMLLEKLSACALCNMMIILTCFCCDSGSSCFLCLRCVFAARFYFSGLMYNPQHCEWEA